MNGRVPSDVPSWHKRGWTAELSASQRELLCDNALRALVDIHQIDDPEDLQFLRAGPGTDATALQRYLHNLVSWYEWCHDDLRVGADMLRRALAVILDSAPDDETETIVWGDARVGNMCFADDLSVLALFDWETATTGRPTSIWAGGLCLNVFSVSRSVSPGRPVFPMTQSSSAGTGISAARLAATTSTTSCWLRLCCR
ncbi:phosphotransferase enzyme family protein [Mycobacterium xenopi 4042]|uniref:Phosphotransferase enzyme family protein n=1 Tax=Mycobacterium xenopi 4042 TaxID=1299334 RepID=X8AHL5_MYCXE|nr:phosphotransferase enzyme family protein [Mycobacterium xenopi 4042]